MLAQFFSPFFMETSEPIKCAKIIMWNEVDQIIRHSVRDRNRLMKMQTDTEDMNICVSLPMEEELKETLTNAIPGRDPTMKKSARKPKTCFSC